MAFAAICILIGISVIAAVSGYTAKLDGPVSLWVSLPVIVAISLIGGGSIRFAWTLAGAVARQGSAGEFALGLGLFAFTLWGTSIAVQFSQNFVYRIVGVPTHSIRWWRRDLPRRKKPRAAKRY
jgi:hypothetical protein